MNKIYLIILGIAVLSSCEKKPTIEGLWMVTSVMVGDEEMTPDGRWMRFNADFTQESGNGWLQHSVGNWNFDKETNGLTIVNNNGLDDVNEPFKVTLSDKEMTWERTEEGQNVQVTLETIYQLPTTTGDKLLGLWKLEKAVGQERYFSAAEASEDYIFFRWDRRFVIGTEKGKVHGVYHVHGHKPEVELIPYSSQYNRDFWKIDFDEKSITLKLLNTDSVVTRKFIRIHNFPQN